jgi:hypothetical protein
MIFVESAILDVRKFSAIKEIINMREKLEYADWLLRTLENCKFPKFPFWVSLVCIIDTRIFLEYIMNMIGIKTRYGR